MSEPLDPIRQRASDLIARAADDLRVAEAVLAGEQPAAWAAAFHAQQAAEKAIKAFLVFRGVDFRYTHDIRSLLDLIEGSDDWKGRVASATTLTVYATTARYVIQSREITVQQASDAVVVARTVHSEILHAMRSEGLPR